MSETIETLNGPYVVYRKAEAGAPELHKGGPWFFEPADYDGNEVYSKGYGTRRDAVEAAYKDGETLASEAAG